MGRKRDRNSDEWFRGRIRELQAEVRRLQKQLRSAEKSFEYLVEDDQDDEKDICENCGKGEIKVTDLKIKNLITCSICDFRKVENK